MEFNVPIFFINLERSNDRRKNILKMLKKKEIDGIITKAVDGNDLNIEELKKNGTYDVNYAVKKFSRDLSPNEIGCALSHLNIYTKIVDENIAACIICEDDINLVEDFKKKINKVLDELPSDWELVYLWYRTKEFRTISDNIISFPSKTHIPGGAVCYMLKKSGAKKLLKEAFPIHYPSDSLIGRGYRWGIKTYGTDPQLAKLNLLFPSTIRRTKMIMNLAKKILIRILVK